jgi:hypothetical protein
MNLGDRTSMTVAVPDITEAAMFTLSIEHEITDYLTWKTAFDRFAAAREQAGVLGDRIRRPVDDLQHLVIELDFKTRDGAEDFRDFLTTVVWPNPDASPALSGRPTTRILEPAGERPYSQGPAST